MRFAPFKVIFLIFLVFFFSKAAISANSEKVDETLSSGEAEKLEREASTQSKNWSFDAIKKAASFYNEAARKRLKLGQIKKASHDFRKAADLNVILNEKKEALKLLRKALKINKNADLDERIETLSALSLLFFDPNSVEESKKLFEEALRFSRKSENPSAKASALFSAGEYYFFKKELAEGMRYFELSLEEWKKSGDSTGEAKCLLEIGYVLIEQNSFDEVFQKLESSLEKSVEAGDLRGQALAYSAFGLAYNVTAQKQKALEFYRKAENIFPENLDYSNKAIVFNGIGSIQEDYGQWNISLNYRRQALDFYKRTGNRLGELATLPSLVTLCFLNGENEAALRFAKDAEDLSARLNAPFYLAKIRRNLGDYYLETNAPEKSLVYFRQALDFFEKNDFRREIAIVSANLGQIYVAQNQFGPARKYLARSLELNREVKDDFAVADSLFHLAKLDNAENRDQEALDEIENSVKITELLYSDVSNSKLKSTYFSNVFNRYEFYINLLMKAHKRNSADDLAVRALQAAEKSRARSMFENLSFSEADFIKDADSETIRHEKEIRVLLHGKADKLSNLLDEKAGKAEIAKVSDEICELENQLEEIKALLKENSPAYYAIKNPAPFDVENFQRNVLDENSLFLEFSLGENESYLWLIGKNDFAVYTLPPQNRIEAKIETLRNLLSEQREMRTDEKPEDFQTRLAEAEKNYRIIARDLSRELFGQVAEKFGEKRLIIVPDGKLGYFPVSALPRPGSENDQPFLLTNEIVYEPSALTFSTLARSGRKTNPASKSLLMLSDPVFSKTDSRFTGEDQNDNFVQNERAEKYRFVESLDTLARLKSSKTEADSIIKILGAKNSDNFSGFSASRERLLNTNVGDYKILHFATHGMIDENRPELSGIVLSRFNEKGENIDELFRLHDIYGLNLNSDLVVLSACYSGVGKEVKGEGLMSLNNAFLSVGAKAVLSSLWKVEDGATLELMKNFYEAMAAKNITPSKALQKAQIKMLQSERYKSPFYWAAFTVHGDVDNVPQISDVFSGWKYVLPMPVILLFGAFLSCKVIRRRNRM